MKSQTNKKKTIPKPIPKEKTFTIRIDQQTLENMNMFKEVFGISKSELTRKSIRIYMLFNLNNQDTPNPKVLFSQNMLKPLLDSVNESEIEKIAEISFQNGISDLRFVGRKISNDDISFTKNIDFEAFTETGVEASEFDDEKRHSYVDSQLLSLVSYVFAPDGQNWFISSKYFWRGVNVVFQGKHRLGNNFSLFIKFLLEKYLGRFNYEILREDFEEIKSLSKIKNENNVEQTTYSITLIFSPKQQQQQRK